MNSYEEAKKYLAEIGINVKNITRETSDYIFAALDDGNIDINEIKCFAAPQTPPEILLEVLGLNSDYFESKKILDIGGGFSGMPFLLEKYVNQYIVCDPCFEYSIVKDAIDRAIITQNYVLDFDKQKSGFFDDKQKVLGYINMRKNFDQKIHSKIIINSSKGEDIKGVENNSQDVVLICHILDKNYINYAGILTEASRVLKLDGEILVVEDADNEMRKILTKLGLERKEKYFKIVCRIKKTP